jgi:arginase
VENEYCLTPYFLDRPVPELRSLAGEKWQLVEPALPAGEIQQRLVTLYQPLRDQVADIARRGNRPVSIAGDCCTSIGVSAGLQKAGLHPTLIWLDAHGDFNTWKTTPSGFLGGMPLAMLVGRGDQTMVNGVKLNPILEEKVILTDARDLDPGEREAVAGSAIRHLQRVEALLEMGLPAGPLYVHFDCDVLDPQEVPAVSYPAPGGPSVETLRRVFGRLAGTGRVIAVSFSSWAPDLDQDGHSQTVCLELLDELVG